MLGRVRGWVGSGGDTGGGGGGGGGGAKGGQCVGRIMARGGTPLCEWLLEGGEKLGREGLGLGLIVGCV